MDIQESGREFDALIAEKVIEYKWIAQVKGDPYGVSWEISVVRSDNEHGQKSWGWFDDRKLLISHNGGPCQWPLAPGLGPMMIKIAELFAESLNDKRPFSLSRS